MIISERDLIHSSRVSKGFIGIDMVAGSIWVMVGRRGETIDLPGRELDRSRAAMRLS